MNNIDIISNVIFIFGLLMLVLSLVLYVKRTGDKTIIKKFWASKKELNSLELWMNRLGFVMVIISFSASFILNVS